MKKLARFFLGLAILLLGGGIATVLFLTKPDPKKETDTKPPPLVVVKPIEFETVRFDLPSQGLIEPRQKTAIAAEVSGKVDWVSDRFDAGSEFEKGDDLVRIDSADYLDAVASAEASLAEADLNLETELARQQQAIDDWKALGKPDEEPSRLALREPHVLRARKQLESARAGLAKAQRDLERTTIKAPFAGRIERVHTEIGAFLAPGQTVADFYTTSPYEIRLPLSLDDWTYTQSDGNGNPAGEVVIRAKAGAKEHTWVGNIVRTEGQIERESRSIYLVAEIDIPKGDSAGLIQPGLFVQAAVAGRPVTGVAKIDEEAFFDLERIVVVDSDNKLRLREVEVLRRSDDQVLISQKVSGGDEIQIQPGDRLCLTELADLDELTDPNREFEVRVQKAPQERSILTGEAALNP